MSNVKYLKKRRSQICRWSDEAQVLTIILHMFVDVILCREDLAHRSQKRLREKKREIYYYDEINCQLNVFKLS